MVIFPTQIPGCDSHSPALSDLFLSSGVIICSTMTFPPSGNLDHVVVSVSIDFLSNSQQGALFHLIAYHYSCTDWNNLCNNLRDVPWKDIFKFSASVAASDFFEWVLVRIDEYIHHCKYQVKPQASPWFSNAGAAVTVDINQFCCLYEQNKSSEPKVKSKQASKSCKIVLEAAKLAYAN